MQSWLKHLFSAIIFIGLLQAGVAHSQTTYTDRFAGSVTATGMKQPVRVATTGAISLVGQQTIDGVAVVQGDRVLVKNQADQTTNGIYQAGLASWLRTQDFSGPSGVVQGQQVVVNAGTQAGAWSLTSADPVCVDNSGGNCGSASNITFTPFTGVALLPIGTNQVLANITGGSASPIGIGVSALLDSAIGNTRGSLAMRGASGWTVLPPGTSGFGLEANGAGADPTWASFPGTGTMTSVTFNNGLTGGTVTGIGTSGLASIANNKVLCNNSGSTNPPTTANCAVTGTGSAVLGTGASISSPIIASATIVGASIDTTTIGVTQALNDSSGKLATTLFANPGSSVSQNGYEKGPSGVIVQWFNGSWGFNDNINFPITYPNACFMVVCENQQTTNSAGWTGGAGCSSNSQFYTNLANNGSASWNCISVGN